MQSTLVYQIAFRCTLYIVAILSVWCLLSLINENATPKTLAAPAVPAHPQINTQASLGLASFSVKLTKKNTVLLEWETGSELQILGFNVWKRTFSGEWTRLNSEPIPAKNPGEILGNTYLLRDLQVKSGKRYFYQLEVISTDGYSAFTEPVKIKIP